MLDVSKYRMNHPGGNYLIVENIGKDISKFFYGGYQFENQSGLNLKNTHSNIAKRIVNSIVYGRLEKPASIFTATIQKRHPVNSSVQTVTFATSSPVVGLKKFYSDINMIGKHFLVRSLNNKHINRHYTVANCMEE